jgi:RNA polymerase sigma-70 factor (ECF subfamily)
VSASYLPGLCEGELLTLAQQNDPDAFAELMSRSAPASLKLALSILRDWQDAEDEVQNSYWKAWRHVRQFQRESKFSTWISRIVINQCLMRLRKSRRAAFLYLDAGVEDGTVRALHLPQKAHTPEAEYSRNETGSLLLREVRRLPPLLRNVLVMRDVDELAMDDVARRLGISLVAAKSRLLRARQELRRRLAALEAAH